MRPNTHVAAGRGFIERFDVFAEIIEGGSDAFAANTAADSERVIERLARDETRRDASRDSRNAPPRRADLVMPGKIEQRGAKRHHFESVHQSVSIRVEDDEARDFAKAEPPIEALALRGGLQDHTR